VWIFFKLCFILVHILKRKPVIKSKAIRKKLEQIGISLDDSSLSSTSLNKRENSDKSSSIKQTYLDNDEIVSKASDTSRANIKAREALRELDDLKQSILEYKCYLQATNRFVPTESIDVDKETNALQNSGSLCLNQPLIRSKFDEPYPKYLNTVKSPKKILLTDLNKNKLKNYQTTAIFEASKKTQSQ